MVRNRLYLVIVSAAVAVGCMAAPDLPRDIWIEADFSEGQRNAILDAVAEWNALSQVCLGQDAIIYKGVYDDPDGFKPDDYGDDRQVIYLRAPQEIYDEFNQGIQEGHFILGIATYGDIVLFSTPKEALDEQRFVALHELGHFLGLGHTPVNFDGAWGSVMYWETNDEQAGHLTPLDIEAFCIEHDCTGCPF